MELPAPQVSDSSYFSFLHWQIPAEWTAATDHECGAWDGNVTIVLDVCSCT